MSPSKRLLLGAGLALGVAFIFSILVNAIGSLDTALQQDNEMEVFGLNSVEMWRFAFASSLLALGAAVVLALAGLLLPSHRIP